MAQNFLEKIVAVYDQEMDVSVPTFCTGMYAAEYSDTEHVSVDIARANESIAKEVTGNAEEFVDLGEETNKDYVPLEYRQTVLINNRTGYRRDLGEQPFSSVGQAARTIKRIMRSTAFAEKRIKRAVELRSIGALLDGQIVVGNETISFNRKATHNFTASTAWTAAGADIEANLKTMGELIRKDGLVNVAKLVVGETALTALYSKEDYRTQLDQRWRGDISKVYERDDMTGGIFHGIITAGSWQFKVYSFPQYYENAAGVQTRYLPADKVIALPEMPKFTMAYGGIPLQFKDNLLSNGMPPIQEMVRGEKLIKSYTDMKRENYFVSVCSRPLPLPVAVDQFVVADVA